MTRVLIVDDHAACAEAFARVLAGEASYDVVGVAGSWRDAVDLAAAHRPRVIVCEYGLPEIGGASLIARLRSASPRSRVLIVSFRTDRHRVATALRVGASGFVAKTASLNEVFDALRRVSRGEIVVGAGLLTGAISALRDDVAPLLTDRELQVIELAATGLSTAGIAARLEVRPNTARNHLQRAFEKLGVHSRTEAVVHAQRLGLVAIPA